MVRANGSGKKKFGQQDDEPVDHRTPKQSLIPEWVKEQIPDTMGVIATLAVAVMLINLIVLLVVNSTGDIGPWMGKGITVETLDRASDKPKVMDRTSSSRSRKDDLTERYAAMDMIEKAVRQGNLGGASAFVRQLNATGQLNPEDITALTDMINTAQAQNPIFNLSECRPQDLLKWISDNGGSTIEKPTEALGVIVADFDQNAEQAHDSRGRGIAALEEIKAGAKVLAVPESLWITTASPEGPLAQLFAEQAAHLSDFTKLVLTMLHESHKEGSKYWNFFCSLPLHVPLPFQWSDEELPPEFAKDAMLMAERAAWKQVADLSYELSASKCIASPLGVFTAEQLSPEKWAWAVSIIMSRGIVVKRSSGMFSRTTTLGDAQAVKLPGYFHTQIAGAKKEDGHEIVLIPGVDMLNHGTAGHDGTAVLEIKDGKAVVTAGAGGLKRGGEITMSYGTSICGFKGLNLYGFAWVACPGDPSHGPEEVEGAEGAEGAEGEAKEL